MPRSYTTDRIGPMLKSAREGKGLKQYILARELSISPQTLSAYENGSKLPTLDNLMSLAEALDLSIDALLGCHSPADRAGTFTLGDFARAACALLRSGEGEIIRGQREEFGEAETFPALAVSGQPLLERFLLGYNKMSELRQEGIIDDELFAQWFSASLAELDRCPLRRK